MDANWCLAVLAASRSPLTLQEAAPTAGLQQLPHTERLLEIGCSVTAVVWPPSQSFCTDPLVCASSSRCYHPHPACTCWESQFPQPTL